MKHINIFKKIYYSIICKKYNEMIEEKSMYSILYLAFMELLFTVLISFLVAKQFFTYTFTEIYKFAEDFLVDFFYNSVSLTFDLILIISIVFYIFRKIRKLNVKYYQMFGLATYSSTMAMIIKYIVFIINYTMGFHFKYLKHIYIVLVIIYFLINYKKVFNKKAK